MAQTALSVLFQRSALMVTSRLSGLDSSLYEKAEQRLLKQLRQLIGEVRLDIRDYEYADTRAELLQHAREARARLATLRTAVLAAGEAGIFGAADVAQLTAGFDEIDDRLQ